MTGSSYEYARLWVPLYDSNTLSVTRPVFLLEAADGFEGIVAEKQRVNGDRSAVNRPALVALAQGRNIPLASHDDTTLEEVKKSIEEGVALAEFPTTLDAAKATLIAARELNPAGVPQKSWEGQRLIYTQGYGVVLSPVGEVRSEEPGYIVSGLGPELNVDTARSELEVDQPRL